MKRIWIIALAGMLYCGSAVAQDGPDNLLQALLGPGGPVQGLTQSLHAGNLQPLVDGLVSDTGLVQSEIAPRLNHALTGLLVDRNPGALVNGLGGAALATTSALAQSLMNRNLESLLGPAGLVGLSGLTPRTGGVGSANGSLALPGLEGGTGFSASQMREVNSLLAR